MIDDALIEALPKTDLHLHLDGSMRTDSLIELARERSIALPSYTVDGLHALVFKDHYADLGEYLQGFAYTTPVLQDPEALERAAFELAEDNIAEGVRYIEVRFAPQLHINDRQSFDDVLLAVNRGLERAMRAHERSDAVAVVGEPPFRYGLIVCAMRMFTPDFSPWYSQLDRMFPDAPPDRRHSMASLALARATVRCRDRHGVPIVGFDLAGQEDGYPARQHQDAYAFAHQHFLKKTVHAGEAYGPESIFEAITLLHADRIGHGYHLYSPELYDGPDPTGYTRRLANYIADRRITIEVCITSNLQTNPAIGDVQNHHLGRMIEDRISATLCTDNRLVSHTTISRELRLAVDAFDMGPDQLRNTIIYGFKRSFFPGSYREKRKYVRHIIDHYDQVVDNHRPQATTP
ncbi:MAG: adenosine deaminase family protein [Myxococcota bacterium]